MYNVKELIQKAIEAKSKALPIYSNFHVGAALLSDDGKIYQGANIENSSYSLTICAERTAAFAAILDGKRKFKAIALVGDTDDYLPPCGACRQVLSDLCGKEIDVILVNGKDETKTVKLGELLPYSFGEEFLKK
ncbi:MAG: cytidine deaminase [Melioribacteraceae bacterium]|jgi:cytidine deaminase|nr:cytidine deaminase [Melioribacteraceae bacterium]